MNELPTPNVDLLDQTLEHVTKLAKMTEEAGYDVDVAFAASDAGLDVWDQDCWLIRADGCGIVGCWATVLAGEHISSYARFADRAQELLGLTETEAFALFYSRNDLEALSEVVQDIKDGAYRG